MNDPAATQTARRLRAQMREGTLATLTSDGAPFASLVTFALDEAGQPLLLLSTLARHTQNLLADARASLLVVEASENDAQTRARVSLSGQLTPIESAARIATARKNFLESHPGAKAYVDFPDFRFYVMALTRLHVVEGFGRIADLPATVLAA